MGRKSRVQLAMESQVKNWPPAPGAIEDAIEADAQFDRRITSKKGFKTYTCEEDRCQAITKINSDEYGHQCNYLAEPGGQFCKTHLALQAQGKDVLTVEQRRMLTAGEETSLIEEIRDLRKMARDLIKREIFVDEDRKALLETMRTLATLMRVHVDNIQNTSLTRADQGKLKGVLIMVARRHISGDKLRRYVDDVNASLAGESPEYQEYDT